MPRFCTALHRSALNPPHQAPKGLGKVAHFHQHATVQNGPPGTPVRSGTCRSPIGGGGVG